jgi:hypothetical protein
VLFVALSLADLHLTRLLLYRGQGQFYESNPVAQAWLKNYGWPGMVIFKISALAVFGAVALFVSMRRPRAGRWLMTFACLVVGAVACFSALLLIRANDSSPPRVIQEWINDDWNAEDTDLAARAGKRGR